MTTQSVVFGQAASFTYSVAPLYGSYAGTVSFAVAGLPPGATYTVNPSTLAATAGPQNVTLTVQTAQPMHASTTQYTPWQRGLPMAAFLVLIPLGLRKRAKAVLGARILTVLLLLGGVVRWAFLQAAAPVTASWSSLASTTPSRSLPPPARRSMCLT